MLDSYYNIEKRLNRMIHTPIGKRIVHKLLETCLACSFAIKPPKISNESGVSDMEYGEELIVSLTSFPARMPQLKYCLASIFSQTWKPNRIILWLAEEQFPCGEKDVTADVLQFKSRGLEIRFCRDLRSHKKYYYTVLENPEACVITVDDDAFYPQTTIELLYRKHLENPKAVCCNRGHLMTADSGNVNPYSKWKQAYRGEIRESRMICPTGVGGVLYPPHSLSEEVFAIEDILTRCLYADDLWLKVMADRKGTVSALTDGFPERIFTVPQSQKEALKYMNNGCNKNDTQWKAITEKYPFEVNSEV